MFEDAAAVNPDLLRCLLSWLAGPLDDAGEGSGRIEEITWLERVKSACCARQARLAVDFDSAQRQEQRAAGVPSRQVGRGVAEQVALARRESPSQGSRHLGLAEALVTEMPHTMAALSAGDVSEWTATVVVKETACLTVEDRRAVDAELAKGLAASGPLRARRDAWAAACRLDPASAVARCRRVVAERRVSVRPAPDAMTYVTALLPVRDGVAVYAALDAAAASARAVGDERSRGQVMADTFVQRVVARAAGGRAVADAGSAAVAGNAAGVAQDRTSGGGVAVEVHLVITDDTLLRGGDHPALLTSDPAGSNTAADLIPTPVARDLVRQAAKVWLRRLYTDPGTGQLVGMESTRRVFEGNLRRMLVLRDQTCRTPWCQAPIRHGDHVHPDAAGGPTTLANGQGLCERCNHTKSLDGWGATVVTDDTSSATVVTDDTSSATSTEPPGTHTVRTTTPTGHTYDSTAPPVLAAVRQVSPRRVKPRAPADAVAGAPRAPAARAPADAVAGAPRDPAARAPSDDAMAGATPEPVARERAGAPVEPAARERAGAPGAPAAREQAGAPGEPAGREPAGAPVEPAARAPVEPAARAVVEPSVEAGVGPAPPASVEPAA